MGRVRRVDSVPSGALSTRKAVLHLSLPKLYTPGLLFTSSLRKAISIVPEHQQLTTQGLATIVRGPESLKNAAIPYRKHQTQIPSPCQTVGRLAGTARIAEPHPHLPPLNRSTAVCRRTRMAFRSERRSCSGLG